MNSYIIGTGSYLPGPAIPNDQVEHRLGMIGGQPSSIKDKIFEANGIISRHFALDESGNATMLNEEIAANAAISILEKSDVAWPSIEMLGVGTTLPDVGPPGFDVMVHGRIAKSLGLNKMETIGCTGVCVSAIRALKAVSNSLSLGQIQSGLVIGSERPSAIITAKHYEAEFRNKRELTRSIPGYNFYHSELLKHTLSDGAGGVLLSNKPSDNNQSFLIEGISITSFADELPPCMYAQTNDPYNITTENTLFGVGVEQGHEQGMAVLRQDHKALLSHIAEVAARACQIGIDRGDISAEVDLFVAHYSSDSLKPLFHQAYEQAGLNLPLSIWRSSLKHRGNTGSAAIFISLDDMIANGDIKSGDRLLLMVPESARFSIAYVNLLAL